MIIEATAVGLAYRHTYTAVTPPAKNHFSIRMAKHEAEALVRFAKDTKAEAWIAPRAGDHLQLVTYEAGLLERFRAS